MLDVSLHDVSFTYPKSGFALRDISLGFRRHTHTAIVGPAGSGASTLLKLVAGQLRPHRGEVRIGSRVVNDLKPARRPLLYVTADPEVPSRWSVSHALVAAVRQRTLDRIDRQREYALAAERWKLESLLERAIGSLSSTERSRVVFARIELLKPAILVADRLLEHLNASDLPLLADDLYRTLRVIGTTVITAPAHVIELGYTESVVALREGAVVQEGPVTQLFARPVDEAAAEATGEVNLVPISIRDGVVESAIGSWEAPGAFEGTGFALVRPDEFVIAASGEESDLIVGVEEAVFDRGRWMIRAILSGSFVLRVSLPRETSVHKGKLVGLRYDPSRFSLIRREIDLPRRGIPTDVVPPLGETR